MAEQNRPASNAQAPDPATSYERAKPDKEAGMGRMDNNEAATPTSAPDSMEKAATNKQVPEHQLNAQDVVDTRAQVDLGGKPATQPAHSMHDEEPLGWDQSPKGPHTPQEKRHPKTDGKGGTP